MRSWRRLVSTLSLLLLAAMLPAEAGAIIDQPAALLVFPYVRVDPAQGIDTVIQIANTGDDEARARCFLENANSHCQPSGTICQSTAQCANGEICVAGWEVTSFLLTLTARQPIGWQAGSGRAELPLQENGDGIPAVPEQPFSGALRCVAVDPNGVPLGMSSLIGRAQIVNAVLEDVVDAGSYNATGFLAGSVDEDGELILAPDGEYSPAAGVVELPFLYDGVADPLAGEGIHETTLVAVPASVDYATPASKPTIVQVAVFNEFETRVTTSFSVPAQLSRRISLLDGPNPAASIFSAAIGGTVSGQMRLSLGGIVALAVEHRVDAEGMLISSVIRQPNALGARQTGDLVALPVPPTPTPTSTSAETATTTPPSTPADTETVAPTPSPMSTDTPNISPTPSPIPPHTATTSPTPNATPTHTEASLPTQTPTPAQTNTVSPTPSVPPTHTETSSPAQTPTPAQTSSASPTPSAPPTHTETSSPAQTPTPAQTNAVSPTPSAPPTHTETVEPSPTETPPPCLGDCDGSGQVTVDELVKMVSIGLGLQDVAFCRNGDRGDGLITVDEIVSAVQNALNGC